MLDFASSGETHVFNKCSSYRVDRGLSFREMLLHGQRTTWNGYALISRQDHPRRPGARSSHSAMSQILRKMQGG